MSYFAYQSASGHWCVAVVGLPRVIGGRVGVVAVCTTHEAAVAALRLLSGGDS